MKSIALALAHALLAACASVAERTERDLAEVDAEVRRRVDVGITARDETRAIELLEAPIGPDEAVAAAVALDPHVREQLASLGVASAARVRAGLVRNPLVELGIVRFPDGTDIDLDLTQPLVELLTLDARTDVAGAELEAERARVARELVRFVHDVRRDWFEVATAERVLELERERVEAEAAATRLAEALHAAGNVVDTVLSRSQQALAEARARLATAEGRAVRARESLARHFGVSGSGLRLESEELSAALPAPPLDELAPAAERASLELREGRARVAALARAAGIAQWSSLLEGSSLGVSARREDGRDAVGPTLAFALPILSDGSAEKAEARARLETALARHDETLFALRETALALQGRLVAVVERARIAREAREPAASRHLDETLRQYNAMQIGVFDVLEARRLELDAQLETLVSEVEVELARLDVSELLAGSLPESPSVPPSAALAAQE